MGADILDSLCEEAAVLLRNLAHSFKDPSYKEEQESRIVFTHSKSDAFHSETPLQFRARGGDIVPYMPVALHERLLREPDPKLPIKEIVSGPGVDYERNYNSLKQLLGENGYEGVEIVRSVIPLRS